VKGCLVWIILASTLIDYGCGLLIGGAFHKGKIEKLAEGAPRTSGQRTGLIISISAAILSLLAYIWMNIHNAQ
jgi:hypothetical protein